MFDASAPAETTHSSASWHPIGSAAPRPIGDPSEPDRQHEALASEITTLAGHLNAAHYRFLKLLDEFDRREGWAGPGIRSLAHWLNWKSGLGQLVAREKVRVARALCTLPLTDAAFERGEISYSKVRAMTRAATPENEADLLNIARHGTAAHVERLVSAYRRSRAWADATPGERENRREERFYCYAEDDETMIFGGRVSVEQGRLLMKALDAMVAEIDADAAVDPESNVSAETDEADSTDASAEGIRDIAADAVAVSAETGDSDSAQADSAPNAAADVSAETLSCEEPDAMPPERPRARRAAFRLPVSVRRLRADGHPFAKDRFKYPIRHACAWLNWPKSWSSTPPRRFGSSIGSARRRLEQGRMSKNPKSHKKISNILDSILSHDLYLLHLLGHKRHDCLARNDTGFQLPPS